MCERRNTQEEMAEKQNIIYSLHGNTGAEKLNALTAITHHNISENARMSL